MASALLVAQAALALVLGCSGDSGTPAPEITGQGFALEEVQSSRLGDADALRVRIEAPAGIEHVVIRERSYEADLARTPEARHLPLFGLDRRTWSKTDVTLDFAGYVSEKVEAAGDYAIGIEVTDRGGQSTAATLRVRVEDAFTSPLEEGADAAPPADAGAPTDSAQEPFPDEGAGSAGGMLEEGAFRLERVGQGPVVARDGHPGLRWQTIEAIHVTIRMEGDGPDVRGLARLAPGEFEHLESRRQLDRVIAAHRAEPAIELATANDAAAGAAFAIVRETGSVALLAESSTTTLSELGTTVALSGRFKR